jgi:hypothetical protein
VELLNLEKYKAEIHRTLISKLDLEKLSRVNSSQARQAVSGIVKEIIADQRVPLNFDEQEKIQADLLDEVFGLGPLEPLLRDPKISDILVNDKDHVFIEKGGLAARVIPPSATIATCCRSSTASSRAWAAEWMSPRPWSMPACPTAPASTPSFRRWRSTGLPCPSAVSAPAPGRQPAGAAEEHFRGDDGGAGLRGQSQHQHRHLRRHRLRQDYAF